MKDVRTQEQKNRAYAAGEAIEKIVENVINIGSSKYNCKSTKSIENWTPCYDSFNGDIILFEGDKIICGIDVKGTLWLSERSLTNLSSKKNNYVVFWTGSAESSFVAPSKPLLNLYNKLKVDKGAAQFIRPGRESGEQGLDVGKYDNKYPIRVKKSFNDFFKMKNT